MVEQEAEQRHPACPGGGPLQGEQGQGITGHTVKRIPKKETELVTDSHTFNSKNY